MSYHKYSTEGIILKRLAMGESNVVVYVLTLDFGLIIASAQSARLQKSKLRPALVEWTHSAIAAVKGKNGWKITDAEAKENFFAFSPTLARISSILLKMIAGEVSHPEIFRIVFSGLQFLKTVEEKDVPDFEILIVLRILKELGYVSTDGIEEFVEKPDDWSYEILKKVFLKKTFFIKRINKGLKESQL